jgi:glutathione S-transferase
MTALTLYTNPMSRGRIARWMLEEVGEPYEVRNLGYGSPEPEGMKSADFLAINPMGKVPALVHHHKDGDRIVTEGAAICAYLADAFPGAGLAPAPGDRAAYYRWLFFAAGPIEAAVTNKALGVVVEPGKERMAGYGNFETVMAAIDGVLDGRAYIAGDRFSAADVYFGSQIGWGMMFGSIAKTPAREVYWQGLSQRPAYLRANALDDAAMPKPN